MGVFRGEGVDQARKGATRDGKRRPGISRKDAEFDAKTQRTTLRLRLPLRLCVKLFFVLVEEKPEVAAHVGFVEGVFGGGRFPRGRAVVGLRQQQLLVRRANPEVTNTRTRETATTHKPIARRPRPSGFNK